MLSLLCGPSLTSIHDYWKNYSFDYMDICHIHCEVMSLFFSTLSTFIIDFLPRSKSLNFIAVVIATLVKVSWRLLGQVFCPLGVPLRSSHIFYPTLWYDALLQLSWSHETPHGQHFQDGRAKRPNSGFLMALLNYITHHETTHHWTLSLSKRIN